MVQVTYSANSHFEPCRVHYETTNVSRLPVRFQESSPLNRVASGKQLRIMAPSFLNFKELRRRSRASFKTERSNTDNSSNDNDDVSHGTAPTTGSITPASLAAQSDPALHLQVKDHGPSPPPIPQNRPLLQPPNKRFSVGGMSGLGSPSTNGSTKSFPVSHYAPRITNVTENSWVRWSANERFSPRTMHLPACLL